MKLHGDPSPNQMRTAAQALSQQLKETIARRESRYQLCLRLFAAELRSYTLFSILSFVILLTFILLQPHLRMVNAALYFCFLGGYSLYTSYRQSFYGMDELIGVCYVNRGRLFLYKCALSSLFQLIAFLLLILMEAFHQRQFQELFLHTVFPLLFIQCATLLFERILRRSTTVLLSYLVLYGSYFVLLFNVPFTAIHTKWLAGFPIYPAFAILLILYVLILVRKGYLIHNNQKKDILII